ncbi:ABC transporter ATP-binding protein [Arthrobacter rhombi]|uniref:ABC transporter ATP-binding protein n=1 Tax=Arthrobacter rhombi TaxID=71253 RepID=UPI003FD11F0D
MVQHQNSQQQPDAPASFWQTVSRLGPQIRPFAPRLFAGFLCALGAGVVALTIPQVLGQMVKSVLHAGGSTADVWFSVGIVALLGLAEAVLVFFRRIFVITPAARIETNLRVGMYQHLQRLPVAFHDKWGSGQLLSRSMADLGLLRRWLAFGSIMLIVSTVTVLVGLTLMFTSSWLLGTIYLIGAIPITIRAFYFRNVFRIASRLSQDQAGDLATNVEESVHGIRVIKAFGRGSEALEGFGVRARRLRDTEINKARTLSGFLMFVVSIPEVTLGVGLLVGIWLTAQGELDVGDLTTFFATAAVLAAPVEGIGMLLGMTLTTKTALDRHFDVMDTLNSIDSPTTPARPASPEGRLSLRNVSFSYPDARPGAAPVLAAVDLEVEPGETMALVGTTGSGKSTLLQLIPRLYETSGGSVAIDDVDVRHYDLEELRTAVSVAFEDTTLFSSSISENILLGASIPAGTDPRTALEEALDVAQAHFAHDLEDGVDTVIGEEGLSLSGGQRQRIALARAIAAKPRVLVLDDPLSALDVRTEEAVTERLRAVVADMTTLIVAHRPSTVMLADRVALLRDGRIDDVGTHTELLSRSDHYRYVIASLDDPPTVEDVLQTKTGKGSEA